MANNYTSNITAIDCFVLVPDFENANITSLPDSVVPTWIFFCVVNGIAAPPTVIINLLIIWTVLEDESIRSVGYNLLLAALAVTDLVVGLMVQPFFVWWLACLMLEWSLSCQLETSLRFVILTFGSLTLCTLMIASVERYLAIEHPNFYTTHVTTKKLMIAATVIWISMPTAMATARILTNQSGAVRKLPVLVTVGANAVIILFCTIKVQVTAYRHRRAIAQQEAAVQQQEQQNQLMEYKHTFTVSMLVLAIVLFYCPFIITAAIIEAIKGKDVPDDFKYISQPIYITFAYLQSLVNPLIMSLRLSYLRQGVKNKLFCLNGLDTEEPIEL